MSGAAALSVDEIVAVLESGADRPLGPGVAVTQLDHALQTAAALRHDHPDDIELAVAGLVHDLGQLLPGARDETHAHDGGAAVRGVLGERVAGIVALHVEAKRYLVATDGNYQALLTEDSVVSLGRQGGVLEPGRGVGVPGPALGGRCCHPAPGRRRRQGPRPRGCGPRGVGTSSPPDVTAAQQVRHLSTVGRARAGVRGSILRGVCKENERRGRRGPPHRGTKRRAAASGCGRGGPATGGGPGGTSVAALPARGPRAGESYP